ncbi:MAG: hypothetical protein E7Z89_03125 [Cyanobacteria bacterium SIG28]|nr:hypothetical protein [Cyanobacteria bacterium SIG28]
MGTVAEYASQFENTSEYTRQLNPNGCHKAWGLAVTGIAQKLSSLAIDSVWGQTGFDIDGFYDTLDQLKYSENPFSVQEQTCGLSEIRSKYQVYRNAADGKGKEAAKKDLLAACKDKRGLNRTIDKIYKELS